VSSTSKVARATKLIKASKIASIVLSEEQTLVLERVKAGENVFFSGSAGTGKSVLLREIIKWCHDQGKTVAVTAATGIASVNIGGSTLHSWAGIGLGKEQLESLVTKITRPKRG
jgi:ATP-dependent DNA helicase PIF1